MDFLECRHTTEANPAVHADEITRSHQEETSWKSHWEYHPMAQLTIMHDQTQISKHKPFCYHSTGQFFSILRKVWICPPVISTCLLLWRRICPAKFFQRRSPDYYFPYGVVERAAPILQCILIGRICCLLWQGTQIYGAVPGKVMRTWYLHYTLGKQCIKMVTSYNLFFFCDRLRPRR